MRSEAVAVPVGQLKFVASSDVRRKASSYVTEAQSVTELPFDSHNSFSILCYEIFRCEMQSAAFLLKILITKIYNCQWSCCCYCNEINVT